MMLSRPLALMATTALIGLSAPVFAQDKSGLNLDENGTGTSGGVSQLVLSQQLFAMGVEAKDPLLALTAARIASGIETKDGAAEKETTESTVEEEADTAETPADSKAMLAAAREYAAGDETMLSLIEDTEAASTRGRIGGATRHVSALRAGSVDVWKIPYYGGSYAEIGVSGDGDAPLGVRLTDENGNGIVGCRSSGWDTFYCDWVPKWNGYFYLKVANNGRKRNTYYLLTN